MADQKYYQPLLNWSRSFAASAPTEPVNGENYGLETALAFHTSTIKLPEGGRVEVNLVTPESLYHFHWQAEITIDDASEGLYQHVLLQKNGAIVETYGKNVIPVDDAGAEAILNRLRRLAPS